MNADAIQWSVKRDSSGWSSRRDSSSMLGVASTSRHQSMESMVRWREAQERRHFGARDAIHQCPAEKAKGNPWGHTRWKVVSFYLDRSSIETLASNAIELEFRILADQWSRETRRSSVVSLRYIHPSYQRILAMGEKVIPFILRELRDRPDRWFAALQALTKANPTNPTDSFDAAVQAWLKWGRDNNYDV